MQGEKGGGGHRRESPWGEKGKRWKRVGSAVNLRQRERTTIKKKKTPQPPPPPPPPILRGRGEGKARSTPDATLGRGGGRGNLEEKRRGKEKNQPKKKKKKKKKSNPSHRRIGGGKKNWKRGGEPRMTLSNGEGDKNPRGKKETDYSSTHWKEKKKKKTLPAKGRVEGRLLIARVGKREKAIIGP